MAPTIIREEGKKFNSGIAVMDFNPTYNDSDALTVEFTIYAQLGTDGYGFAGTGDLT